MTRSAAPRRPNPPRPQPGPSRGRRWRRPRLPFPPIVGAFLLIGVLLTAATTWLLASHLHAGALVAYFAGVNLTTFGAYLYDKSVAASEAPMWRVPEAVLHLLAFAGGTPAALVGQQILRHKTRKPGFRLWFWVIAAIQGAALAGWAWGATQR